MRAKEMTGTRVGRLVVVRREGTYANGAARWECLCDCGTPCFYAGADLRIPGKLKSCGCYDRENMASMHTTHGDSHSPTYRTWADMKRRCYDPARRDYRWYGARGISVCDRWRNDYSAFLLDMGQRPQGMTVDRLNPDGHYEPGNCRWATPAQQATENRRNTSIKSQS